MDNPPKKRGRPVTNPPRPPKKAAKIPGSTRMEIIISQAEKTRLEAMAQAAGLTFGEFIRRTLAAVK